MLCPPAGVALATYSVVGVFGAARYGLSTAGDVLVNRWLPGRGDGVLAACTIVYLACCMAPIVFVLRVQLEK